MSRSRVNPVALITRYPIASALLLSALAILAAFLYPVEVERSPQDYPWNIDRTAHGSIRVLDLTIGESTVVDARRRVDKEADISLFVTPSGAISAEVFFQRIDLGGLGARLVVVADLPQEELQAMFERGLRITPIGEGGHRVTPHPEDVARIGRAPIASLAYLPTLNVDREVLRHRFGEPDEVIVEAQEAELWLYPERGTTLVVHRDGRRGPVFQYTHPERLLAHFDRLPQSLESSP